MTQHPQVVLCKDIHVDEEIAPLIRELWDQNIQTSFSCQGSPTCDEPGCDCSRLAYVAFPNHGDAYRFHSVLWIMGVYSQLERWPAMGVVRFDNADISAIIQTLKGEIA